jgi:hypothetical protein
VEGEKRTDTSSESFSSSTPLPYPHVPPSQIHAKAHKGKIILTIPAEPADEPAPTTLAAKASASPGTRPSKSPGKGSVGGARGSSSPALRAAATKAYVAAAAAVKGKRSKAHAASLQRVISEIINLGKSTGTNTAARSVMAALRSPHHVAAAPKVQHTL